MAIHDSDPMYQQAKAWIEENTPYCWPREGKLRKWWYMQRAAIVEGSLSADDWRMLARINFPLKKNAKSLKPGTAQHILNLREYALQKGHCFVNKKDQDHNFERGLGSFVARVRDQYRADPDHYIANIVKEVVPFSEPMLNNENLSPHNQYNSSKNYRNWLIRYNRYLYAVEVTGNRYIHRLDKEFAVEGNWINKQRTLYREGDLELWKVFMLCAAGIEISSPVKRPAAEDLSPGGTISFDVTREQGRLLSEICGLVAEAAEAGMFSLENEQSRFSDDDIRQLSFFQKMFLLGQRDQHAEEL